ncbi:hypothetical protein [Amycolatopsis minnesotensis]|uniref:Uncharacterized protein n=1 Tax=Amycolatopsis minnesotensis TaxID=337894 RepID=A0ABP5BR99_9PSEU
MSPKRLLGALVRRLLRRRVPAGAGPRDNPGHGGAAGVREPRRPRPSGPSGAAARPVPPPEVGAHLKDPRG